jgi:hypothetical protein
MDSKDREFSAAASSCRGGTHGRTMGDSISAGRLDGAPTRSPHSRQSPERLRAFQTRADRGSADDEATWAELADTPATSPEVSLVLLEALHTPWVALLRSISETEYGRTVRHPEHGRIVTLEPLLAQYAWHSEHHLRHITALRERENWAAAAD